LKTTSTGPWFCLLDADNTGTRYNALAAMGGNRRVPHYRRGMSPYQSSPPFLAAGSCLPHLYSGSTLSSTLLPPRAQRARPPDPGRATWLRARTRLRRYRRTPIAFLPRADDWSPRGAARPSTYIATPFNTGSCPTDACSAYLFACRACYMTQSDMPGTVDAPLRRNLNMDPARSFYTACYIYAKHAAPSPQPPPRAPLRVIAWAHGAHANARYSGVTVLRYAARVAWTLCRNAYQLHGV